MDGRWWKWHYICHHLLLLACGFHCHVDDLGLRLLRGVVLLHLLTSESGEAQNGFYHLHILKHLDEKLWEVVVVERKATEAADSPGMDLPPSSLASLSLICWAVCWDRQLKHKRHVTMTLFSAPKVFPPPPLPLLNSSQGILFAFLLSVTFTSPPSKENMKINVLYLPFGSHVYPHSPKRRLTTSYI